MGPTAGSGGLGLIVGVLEGAMGDLVGLRAFPGAAHDDRPAFFFYVKVLVRILILKICANWRMEV